MKKLLLWIFMLFLLVLPAFAAITDYTFWDDGDQHYNGSTIISPNDGDSLGLQQWDSYVGSQMLYDDDGDKLGNMSINGPNAVEHGSQFNLGTEYTNYTSQVSYYDTSDGSKSTSFRFSDGPGNIGGEIGVNTGTTAVNYYYWDEGNQNSGVGRSIGWHNFTYYHGQGYTEFYIDGSLIVNKTASEHNLQKVIIYSDNQGEVHYDQVKVWQGHLADEPEPPTPGPSTSVVTLIEPVNNSITDNLTNQYSFSFQTNTSAYNCSLYTNETGSWVEEEQNLFGGCYQETANESNSCGGLSTGNYNPYQDWFDGFQPFENAIDGDFGTYAEGSAANSIVNITYTIPGGVNNATWITRDGDGYSNFTIPSACLTGNDLSLEVQVLKGFGDTWVTFSCHDGSTFQVLQNRTGQAEFYEEAILWEGLSAFNHTLPGEGDYLWNVECTDSEGNATFAIQNFSMTVDQTNPTIDQDTSNPLFNNVSFALPSTLGGTGNITGQINFSDENLYQINISTDVEDILFVTGLNQNTYNYTINHNIDGYSPGVHQLQVQVWDGHTAQKIKKWKHSTPFYDNYVEYTWGGFFGFGDDWIRINPEGISGDMVTEKELDRYTWHLTKSNKYKSMSFTVTSNHKIEIVEGSPYRGHLIVMGIENGKWIDFELEDTSGNEKYSVERISDKEVKVTISNMKNKKDHKFKSIGSLNYVTQTYEFLVVNATVSYQPTVTENTQNTITINFTYNSTFINNITGNLTYNNTIITSSQQILTDEIVLTANPFSPNVTLTAENISFNWNFFVEGVSANETNSTNQTNQTVTNTGLVDCATPGAAVGINYTFADESNLTSLTLTTGELVVEYISDTSGVSSVINQSYSGVDSVAVCFEPNTDTFTADVLFQYQIAGYENRDHITQNQSIDNVTDNVVLYSLPSGESTAITVHVRDENDEDLANVLVQAWRYRPSSNDFILAETETTDSGGDAVLNLVSGDIYYKFMIYQNGILGVETDKFKILQNTYEYTIVQTPAVPLEGIISLRTIDANISWDLGTKTFTLVYNDASGVSSQVCLNVRNTTEQINSECSTENSGTITYVVTASEGEFRAEAKATIGNVEYLLKSTSAQIGKLSETLGVSRSIVWGLIMLLVIMLVSLASPKIAIGGSVIGIFFLYILGIIPIGIGAVFSILTVGIIIILLMKERLGA